MPLRTGGKGGTVSASRWHELGIDHQAACADLEVVMPLDAGDTPYFDYADPPARPPKFEGHLLELNHAVRNTLQLLILLVGRSVVEHQNRTPAAGEVLLEGEDLATVAKRVARQQPHLGQRIKDHTRGLDAFSGLQNPLDHLGKFNFRRVIERVLLVGQRPRGGQLINANPVERPPVRFGNPLQLGLCF